MLLRYDNLDAYVREAIYFLRVLEPSEGYFVGFSGGKDSTVALELCRMAGVRHQAYYSCTTIDPPEMYRFIKTHYPDVTWLYPRRSFWNYMRSRLWPPTRQLRWCCTVLKKSPAISVPLKYHVTGVRGEESVSRRTQPRVMVINSKRTVLKPIFHWPEWAVWDFIARRNLPHSELYDAGFGRVGCVVCPFIFGKTAHEVAQRKQRMARWPTMWGIFERLVKASYRKRVASGKYQALQYADEEEYWQAYLNGFK